MILELIVKIFLVFQRKTMFKIDLVSRPIPLRRTCLPRRTGATLVHVKVDAASHIVG